MEVATILETQYGVKIPKNSQIDKDFMAIVNRMTAEGIECECGYLNSLADDEHYVIRFPKDFEDQEMYYDIQLDGAETRKEEYKAFFKKLMQEGEAINP